MLGAGLTIQEQDLENRAKLVEVGLGPWIQKVIRIPVPHCRNAPTGQDRRAHGVTV